MSPFGWLVVITVIYSIAVIIVAVAGYYHGRARERWEWAVRALALRDTVEVYDEVSPDGRLPNTAILDVIGHWESDMGTDFQRLVMR
jgi:hypothetical protein